eukprot:CAMPEP_0176482650 /NCGR_PEP_ID=MMETSP0200_2-20121128/3491_1 /TAXON_ID=947934 /ORGANISM="Chaetoceros sp., Strain GSL56" /LENGTH=684 /DNA_ID=CAMNT_0017878985 /DNA_START=191 /DNA_END=2245 /DNA_ORIENTATION=-
MTPEFAESELSRGAASASSSYREQEEEADAIINTSAEANNNISSSSREEDDLTSMDLSHGSSIIRDGRKAYPWKKFIPSLNPIRFCSWLMQGFSPDSRLPISEVERNTIKTARMLSLLREYKERFGMPERGGVREQLWVLTELCTRLYSSGTPLWVLKPVMSKAAEGLTGSRFVDFVLFTRSGFIYSPSNNTTASFSMERGFDMRMMTFAERILVRLASFASNTRTVHSIKADIPKLSTLIKAARGQSVVFMGKSDRRHVLAKEILDLASEGIGLFYLTQKDVRGTGIRNELDSSDQSGSFGPINQEVKQFWTIDDLDREVFTRLVTMEAVSSLKAMSNLPPSTVVYPRRVILLFRTISAAGAAGLWFSASWYDMGVAGLLAILVALFEGSALWKHERMIFEVFVSFVVGALAGFITITWKEATCFQAIAVASVIDILQGFRVVYSIMEIMSKHTISGGADFLESLLFTGLIAYFLKFGLHAAETVMGDREEQDLFQCSQPISQWWYLLLVPITSLSWSVLFTPLYRDLPLMTFHGILSFVVYWAITQIPGKNMDGIAIFVAALTVTASAGFISRFTGRQALGDTVTGLYVLLPGSYLARGLFNTASNKVLDGTLLTSIVVIAVTIGLGGWTGTMLCSPTILGTNNGLLRNFTKIRALDTRSLSLIRNQDERGKDENGGRDLFF